MNNANYAPDVLAKLPMQGAATSKFTHYTDRVLGTGVMTAHNDSVRYGVLCSASALVTRVQSKTK